MARSKRILVIRLGDLGDVLLAEPALRSLRLAHPTAEIDLITRSGVEPLVRLFDLNLTIIPSVGGRGLSRTLATAQLRQLMALRRRSYDQVVLLHHLTTARGSVLQQLLVRATGARERLGLDNGRGWALTHSIPDLGFGAKHEVTYALDVARAAGGVEVAPVPQVSGIPTRLTSRTTTISSSTAGDAPLHVVLYPAVGAYSLARAWHPERFAELARQLTDVGHQVSIVGANDAADAAHQIVRHAPQAIDHTGQLDIPTLAGFLRTADVVVGGDSFIGHLAAAVGTPVVTIFGPSNAGAWRPAVAIPETGAVVQAGLPCQPCLYTGFRLGRPQGCPSVACMNVIQTGQVQAAIARVTSNAHRRGNSQ